MFVSIIPSFYCNRHCKYCYQLDQNDDKTLLNIDVLNRRLNDLKSRYNIDTISIYGGEISLLDQSYLNRLFDLTKRYCDNVNINSNFANKSIIDIALNKQIAIGTSINLDRDDYKYVCKVLKSLPTEIANRISVDTVITQYYVDEFKLRRDSFVNDILSTYNDLNISQVLFLQYSASVSNPLYPNLTNRDFVQLLLQIYNRYQQHEYNYSIVNFECIDRKCSIDSNIFIVPSGRFASIQYNDQLEYFYQYDNLSTLDQLRQKECAELPQCVCCSHYNIDCQSDHLKRHCAHDVCNGAEKLIEIIKR